MDIRAEFVLRAASPNANFASRCCDFGVSRKTGCRWRERFDAHGVAGLEGMRRWPKESPRAVTGDVVAGLVAIRLAHPTWGSKKRIEVAKRLLPGIETAARRRP